MAGALQLIATLQALPVPPVPPLKNMGEPLEAAPAVAVPPVPPVPPRKHDFQLQDGEQPGKAGNQGGVARDLHFREIWGNRGNQPEGHAEPAPALPEPRRTAWRITLDGRPVCSMVGEPMTYAEALEAARWRWDDAEVATD